MGIRGSMLFDDGSSRPRGGLGWMDGWLDGCWFDGGDLFTYTVV